MLDPVERVMTDEAKHHARNRDFEQVEKIYRDLGSYLENSSVQG
jgi:hypothetical protein